MKFTLTYDISDNKRRLKVHKFIQKSGGSQLQFSVYLVEMKLKSLQTLLDRIKPFIQTEQSDNLYILTIDAKHLSLHMDNNRLRYYLSNEIEEVFI